MQLIKFRESKINKQYLHHEENDFIIMYIVQCFY